MAVRCDPSRSVANLRSLRERAGLSQDELGARAHISQSKLSRLERGYLSATDADCELLASALEVPVEALSRATTARPAAPLGSRA